MYFNFFFHLWAQGVRNCRAVRGVDVLTLWKLQCAVETLLTTVEVLE